MSNDTSGIEKPTPKRWFSVPEHGENSNIETRLATLDGYITPNSQFFVRSHNPTPIIDAATWQLRLHGAGLTRPLALNYAALQAMPQTAVTRAIECAGNARAFFAEDYGRQAGGAQWHTGAIGIAQWSGVRLREVLERAGVTEHACDVLPVGLDAEAFARPLPITKAMADDTLIALTMNGERLPADHGFPARLIVSGWLGAASIKWLGEIEVATQPLHTHWNTHDYTLAGPGYPAQPPADGIPITVMPVMSVIELDWNARLNAGMHTIRGRAFSGEGRVSRVEYAVDDDTWREAQLEEPNIPAAGVRWAFSWDATPGAHVIRIRATDENGHVQPDAVSWNDHGCLYNAVIAHPLRVAD